MMRKKTVIALVFLLLVVIVAVLAIRQMSSIQAAKQKDATPTLSFRITWKEYSGRGEAISKIVDAYNQQEKTGSMVSLEGGDEDIGAIASLLKSNLNTVFVLPYRYVQYLGMNGDLLDLGPAFVDAQCLFFQQIWALGTYGKAAYGIPWLGHSMALLYNKTLLNKAKVDPASITSLETLLEAIKKVESATDARGIGLVGANSNDLSWMVNQFIYGFGGSLVSEDGSSVTINSQQARDAILFYKNMLGAHAQPTWQRDTGSEVMTHFLNQEVAFEIQGIWGVTDIQKNGSPFEVGVIALQDIGLCSEVGPMMLALPAAMDEETKQEAYRFIRYLISPSAQEQIMMGEYSPEHDAYYPFRTPIRVDMAGSDTFRNHPEYWAFIRGFQEPSIDVPVPKWQEVKEQVYEPGLGKVMGGKLSIAEFLAIVTAQGNRILGGPRQ